MVGWKYKIELTDVLSSHHHHISCMKCGFVVPIKEHFLVEDLVINIAARYNLDPKQHDFEIQGYCKNCGDD